MSVGSVTVPKVPDIVPNTGINIFPFTRLFCKPVFVTLSVAPVISAVPVVTPETTVVVLALIEALKIPAAPVVARSILPDGVRMASGVRIAPLAVVILATTVDPAFERVNVPGQMKLIVSQSAGMVDMLSVYDPLVFVILMISVPAPQVMVLVYDPVSILRLSVSFPAQSIIVPPVITPALVTVSSSSPISILVPVISIVPVEVLFTTSFPAKSSICPVSVPELFTVSTPDHPVIVVLSTTSVTPVLLVTVFVPSPRMRSATLMVPELVRVSFPAPRSRVEVPDPEATPTRLLVVLVNVSFPAPRETFHWVFPTARLAFPIRY